MDLDWKTVLGRLFSSEVCVCELNSTVSGSKSREKECRPFLRIVMNYQPNDTASHPGRLESSTTALLEPQNFANFGRSLNARKFLVYCEEYQDGFCM